MRLSLHRHPHSETSVEQVCGLHGQLKFPQLSRRHADTTVQNQDNAGPSLEHRAPLSTEFIALKSVSLSFATCEALGPARPLPDGLHGWKHSAGRPGLPPV